MSNKNLLSPGNIRYNIRLRPSCDGGWIYCFYPIMGDPYPYLALATLYKGDKGIIGIADPEVETVDCAKELQFDSTLCSLEVLFDRNDVDQTVCLVGFSFGAITAIQLAPRLRRMGIKNVRIVLMDPPFLLQSNFIRFSSENCARQPLEILRALLLRMDESGAFRLVDKERIMHTHPFDDSDEDTEAWIRELRRGLWLRGGARKDDLRNFFRHFSFRIEVARRFNLQPITDPLMMILSKDANRSMISCLPFSVSRQVSVVDVSHFNLLKRCSVANYILAFQSFLDDPI